MKRLPILVAFGLLFCLAFSAVAQSTAGTQIDPAVSQSYLEQVYRPQLEQSIRALFDQRSDTRDEEAFLTLAQTIARENLTLQTAGLTQALSGQTRWKEGDLLTLAAGTKLALLSGSGELVSGTLVNVTRGQAVPVFQALPDQDTCMAGTDCQVRITSLTACFAAQGAAELAASTNVDYNACADALAALGLFRGTDYGYELERTATRTEALVMFLRLLGEEQNALKWAGPHPFTDVPAWADRYVAYAYARGYTNGVSATAFGATQDVTARDYLTFLLRALQYQEGREFAWATAVSDSQTLGVITAGEQALLEQGLFLRAHVAYFSWYVLFARHQAESRLLLWVLEDKGAFTAQALNRAVLCVKGARPL